MKYVNLALIIMSPLTAYGIWHESNISYLRVLALLWLVGVLLDCVSELAESKR